MSEEDTKKFVDLEGLKYFLDKFKYALAHNDDNINDEDTSADD